MNGEWLNPPPDWSEDANGTLHVTSGEQTDFWQSTYYGFRRDTGHALLHKTTDTFTASLTFEGDYDALYDQAGLMLRVSPIAWIKFGIEKTDGQPHLSVVTTNGGRSDWSAQPFDLNGPVTLRATRLDDAVFLQWAPDKGAHWIMARLTPLPSDPAGDSLRAGPYLCSPEGAGFGARFHDFELGAPVVSGLHE